MKIYKLYVQNVILERVIYSENCHMYTVEKKDKYQVIWSIAIWDLRLQLTAIEDTGTVLLSLCIKTKEPSPCLPPVSSR